MPIADRLDSSAVASAVNTVHGYPAFRPIRAFDPFLSNSILARSTSPVRWEVDRQPVPLPIARIALLPVVWHQLDPPCPFPSPRNGRLLMFSACR
jgi:hypothetical protein